MSVEFREYRGFKRKHPTHRKVPLFRILFLAIIIFFLYFQGTFHRLYYKVFPLVVRPPVSIMPKALAWDKWCEKHHGKPFPLQSDMGQCSWVLSSEKSPVPDFPLVRYVVSEDSLQYPLKLHWMGKINDFENPSLFGFQTDHLERWFFHVPLGDTSFVWVADNGCRFPGPCPVNPLEGGVLSISEDFDFEGRESLLMKDQFMGIGESPVYPIMPGRVVSVSKETAGYTVELDHGGNLMTRSTGLSSLGEGITRGVQVSSLMAIARLAPKDSATFNLEVIRNGKFVRWDAFFSEAHPVPDSLFATFRKGIGF